MNINTLIFRNLKKNLNNYYLYVFALVFSVALYFAFVTLQYDPSMDEAKGTIKGGAAVRTASGLLVAIVSIFLLYANTLFIKRRSKEIGLFQLIGMTRNKIFRILSTENFILYFGSLILGIGIGFSFSKLITMILFKTTGVDAVAKLHFSNHAFVQTILVFSVIYLLIMLMNFLFIKRQSILSLFRVQSSTETKVKKMSKFEIIIGILGLISVASGYYASSKLFGGDFTTMPQLYGAMLFILGTVIIGTYLFYKGSVSFIFNVIRKKKGGYLNINEVMSLSSIMFRMKSNALLLTIITTVSALAIALLSLSYIGYYSAEKKAVNNVPTDFTFINTQDFERFKEALIEQDIDYKKEEIEVIQVLLNLKDITDTESGILNGTLDAMPNSVISEKSLEGVDLQEDETLFTGYSDLLQRIIPLHDSGVTELKGKNQVTRLKYLGMRREYPISGWFTAGGSPVVIVDDRLFQQLKQDLDPAIQKESSLYIGISIEEDDLREANDLFQKLNLQERWGNASQQDMMTDQKKSIGLIMFIVGFLGLTFLITSGCILYFKQMDESEDEKPNYTILRKLGFTQKDLLTGIQIKQLFNFGIPLTIGLLHGYFAVQSGWFLFGAEVWTPMLIVMGLYTLLYSIFGVLSVYYYKKVIKASL
ncbi:FtsX-like permease family protein [Bacillus sp. KH172YL63]|uniref:FtsX-like permease family protein n=1 Tax=Bacillus sp. KH172YL63 TaxID=2709784 RepID=UPI0013E4D76C|nr:ABC transporter permease [Bacillus sp. KH172YL63]BCB06053.1 bacitracin export permease protein BceB [Bacillus sp. KH172YL63]